MRDYVDFMIKGKATNNTKEKKDLLIEKIYLKIGVKLSSSLTIKELRSVLND